MRSTPPYRARECARLAGVTVKALYHYERLGLLTPARTNAGYRVYSAKDLQRLDEILALKFVGLPLDQIKALLDSPARSLAEALRAQRRRLKIERRRITRAMRAIRDAERRLAADGQPALERASDASILAMLIDVIEAGDDLDAMRKYFTDAAWPKARDYFAEWPSPAWRDLLREVQAALSDDPAGDRAQALCARWNTLFMGDAAGDIAFRTGLWNAWVDRRQWPPALADRVAMYDMDRIVRFIQESSWATIQDDGRPRGADAMRAPDRVSPTTDRALSGDRACAARRRLGPCGAHAGRAMECAARPRKRRRSRDQIRGDQRVEEPRALARGHAALCRRAVRHGLFHVGAGRVVHRTSGAGLARR